MRRALIPFLLALLATPTCANLPHTDVEVVLPAFPKAVPSTRGPIPVFLVHHLYCGGVAAYGCYTYKPRFIEIEDTMTAVMRWRTLRHEMVHMDLDLAGATLEDKTAENIIAEAIAEQEIHALTMRWPR